DLKLAGSAEVVLGSGPVIVFVTGTQLNLSGGGVTNMTGNPTDLVFMCADSVTNVSLVGNANSKFAVYCPRADIAIAGNGTLYGAVVGKSVTFNGLGTLLHYDAALADFLTDAISCNAVEVSRATPIIATITCTSGACPSGISLGDHEAIVQGTFVSTTTAPTTI